MLRVRHVTTYEYREPVAIGPHRLMLRPRESRDLRLLATALDVTPSARITWAQDVFGNAVAVALFERPGDRIVVDSISDVQLDAVAWPVFPVSARAIQYPFRYSEEEWTDLGAMSQLQYPDPDGRLAHWARGFVLGEQTDTLSLLKDLSAGVFHAIRYQTRDDEGTQPPNETLDRGIGSCRDFAVLLADAARSLGFGARIVSGYLFDAKITAINGSDSTHAWTEIYIPGAGWITFDPTNRSVGGANLIPVAVARDITQVVPIAGTFGGPPQAFLRLTVDVTIAPLIDSEPPPAARPGT